MLLTNKNEDELKKIVSSEAFVTENKIEEPLNVEKLGPKVKQLKKVNYEKKAKSCL